MNITTKEWVLAFIDAVEELAQGSAYMAGLDTVTKVIGTGEELKYAIEHDKTIVELG